MKQLLNNPRVLYSAAIVFFLLLVAVGVDVYNGLIYEDPLDVEIIIESKEHTPSQNLAIKEGRFEIPQLIPEDYNCEKHPGVISESSPAFFESSQQYINRKNKAIQKQIEEVCG